MSADRRATMGIQHLTVVPENFEAGAADAEADGDDADASDGEDAP